MSETVDEETKPQEVVRTIEDFFDNE